MAGLTWSTIKTPALTSEIRFRFGLSIERQEIWTDFGCSLPGQFVT
jgi:hypothetical protein